MEMQADYRVISNQEDARDIIDLQEHMWLLQTGAETMNCSVEDAAVVSRSLSARHQAELTAALVDRVEEVVAQFSDLTDKLDLLLKALHADPKQNGWSG